VYSGPSEHGRAGRTRNCEEINEHHLKNQIKYESRHPQLVQTLRLLTRTQVRASIVFF
jgi:hypothetical protein